MRLKSVMGILLLASVFTNQAGADPYRWCAVYGGGDDGGGTNCYFLTLDQCRAAISGMGGFCAPNQFYDGRPIVTPEESRTPRFKRSR